MQDERGTFDGYLFGVHEHVGRLTFSSHFLSLYPSCEIGGLEEGD